MDEFDTIFVPDERNADNRSQNMDHRTQSGGPIVTSRRQPSGRTVVVPRRTVYGGGNGYSAQPTVIYQQAPQSATSRLLGNISLGEALEMVAMGLAAIQPLPVAPTSQGEVETDVGNLVTYQTALATHAKRDEQLRTIGALLVRVLK